MNWVKCGSSWGVPCKNIKIRVAFCLTVLANAMLQMWVLQGGVPYIYIYIYVVFSRVPQFREPPCLHCLHSQAGISCGSLRSTRFRSSVFKRIQESRVLGFRAWKFRFLGVGV